MKKTHTDLFREAFDKARPELEQVRDEVDRFSKKLSKLILGSPELQHLMKREELTVLIERLAEPKTND